MRTGVVLHLVLESTARFADLAKTGREDQHHADTSFAASLDDRRDTLRRCRNDGKIYVLLDIVERGPGLLALHGFPFGVDAVDTPFEARAQQILEHDTAN